MEVSAHTGDVPESPQNVRQVVHISFDGHNKHSRIVHVKRGTHDDPSPTDVVQKAFPSCRVEDLLQRVDGNDKKERGDGVPLPQPLAMPE